jgi:enoyl-CoA hydratase/carnithine racemase
MTTVERERRGRVEILRLNRPEARNAINADVTREMEHALDEIEADPGVRVVVLTGNGPVFSAGADLKAIASNDARGLFSDRGGLAGITSREHMKPIVAAVNGHALAGGFEIMLACDLAIAADDAEFGIPEVQRGLFAAAGGLIRLPKHLPAAIATELAIVGDRISAARAYELGLVNRVVPADRVLDVALELAERIAANPPVPVRAARQMVREAPALTDDEAWARNAVLAAEALASGDYLEGATAFAEKREPRWKDA